MRWRIRPAEDADAGALADICIATGDPDARYADPRPIPDIWLLPYLRFATRWCLVAEDDPGILGYLVATDDTLAFASRTEADWWPALRRRHPLPDPDDERPQAQLVRRLHAGVLTDLPFLDAFPAQLHIQLVPRARRQGLGTRLMNQLLQALREAGVAGVHLGVSADNAAAIAFYERLGFSTLESHPWGRWMGLRLTSVTASPSA